MVGSGLGEEPSDAIKRVVRGFLDHHKTDVDARRCMGNGWVATSAAAHNSPSEERRESDNNSSIPGRSPG